MNFAIGVYGYTFTRPFSVGGVEFLPLFGNFSEAKNKGRDARALNLTGVLLVAMESRHELNSRRRTLADLEAVLSFSEQQRVVLANMAQVHTNEDVVAVLSGATDHELKQTISDKLHAGELITGGLARPSGGACLQYDAFSPCMRPVFSQLAMERLADQQFNEATGFRSAFYRNVEIVKLGNVPIDVSYSLLFTGLELLANKCPQIRNSWTLARKLETFLNEHGLEVTADETQRIAACRNALFHDGKYVGKYKNDAGARVEVSITELKRPGTLFTDALLKVAGYSDPHINWKRWLDRRPFFARTKSTEQTTALNPS